MIARYLNLFSYWLIYSFLGWVCEVVYAKVRDLGYDVRNRTIGPINPGYGIAAVVLIALLDDYRDNPFLVFLVGGVIATILEFIAHYAFEKAVGVRLWEYKDRPLNIQGRICLGNSILFGLLCVLLMNVFHPVIGPFIEGLSVNTKFIVALVGGSFYLIEVTIIVVSVAFFNKILDEIAQLWDLIQRMNPKENMSFREFMLKTNQTNLAWYQKREDGGDSQAMASLDFDNDSFEDEQDVLFLRLSQIIEDKFSHRNLPQKILYRVFPDLKSVRQEEIFHVLKDHKDYGMKEVSPFFKSP